METQFGKQGADSFIREDVSRLTLFWSSPSKCRKSEPGATIFTLKANMNTVQVKRPGLYGDGI
jgi:hypothetical protein